MSRAGYRGAVGGRFVRAVRLAPDAPATGYPYDLPAVRALAGPCGLMLDRPVTFLVGENGSGKSTLVEALAVATGFNPEGGSRSFRFATRATESDLGRHRQAKPVLPSVCSRRMSAWPVCRAVSSIMCT